jgi:hypothetical protein
MVITALHFSGFEETHVFKMRDESLMSGEDVTLAERSFLVGFKKPL